MWKIFLCGYDDPPRAESPNWLDHFENEFQDKFIILKPKEMEKSGNKEKGKVAETSLLNYSRTAENKHIYDSLKEITSADLVFADATNISFKKFLRLIYSHSQNKPIIIFIDERKSVEDKCYYSFITNNIFNSYDVIIKFFHGMRSLPVPKRSIFQEINLNAIQEEVKQLFEREDRKDPLFRSAILTTQIGQILHYLTHDRSLNPGARYIGSRADEETQLGDGLVQFLIYCRSRDFNIDRIYTMGIKRMEEAVWRESQPILAPRQLRPGEIGYGISASKGEVSGPVVIINKFEDVEKISKGKCIIAISTYEKKTWEEITARIENMSGLIAGTGSPNIHPAIICRELRKPCIVGAKELVENLEDGMIVKMTVGQDIDNNSVVRV